MDRETFERQQAYAGKKKARIICEDDTSSNVL